MMVCLLDEDNQELATFEPRVTLTPDSDDCSWKPVQRENLLHYFSHYSLAYLPILPT